MCRGRFLYSVADAYSSCVLCKADVGVTIVQSDFEAPYTPSPDAIRRVTEVFDFIEANPEKWNQYSYGHSRSEANCFMGLVIRLSRPDDISYGAYEAMKLLGMGMEHADRCDFIGLYITVPGRWNTDNPQPTIDEMRDRVSTAMNYDFRKPLDPEPYWGAYAK